MQNSPLSPEQWIADLFSSKAARQGAVIRRKLRDVERYAGLSRFAAELDRRGYRAVENAGQLVIFCNREPIRKFGKPLSLKESGTETLKVSVSLPHRTSAGTAL